ncbi:HTTM domain-containing protein [Halobacteriaceae bacterium SHR40]|uniref:HTTM domain-containing protein n=1 Tax=Halovenus amylolytica TaxID=2500550 RepID=UPI000FE3C3CE
MTPQGDRSSRQALTAGVRRLWAQLAPIRSRIHARATVETRSLAAFRIALATVILVDLLHRSRHLALFYTDQGGYPVAAYEVTYTEYTGVSIHALSGALWFQQFMFFVAGLFAVAMLVGYRTRLVTFVSFLLLVSLHARNPGVINGGDKLLRLLLFLAVLPPTGERWSIDALRRGTARDHVASFGTAVVLIQPVVVFTQNAIRKHRGEQWYAGEALEIALSSDAMRIGLGNVIVEYPALLTVLDYGWITLLAGSSVFLLLTVGRLRTLAALTYIAAFVGMLTAMAVGLFPLVLIASVLPFLTAPFWDRLAARVPARWVDRLPDSDQLGPLGNPPFERRLLDRLRERGHTSFVTFPRSLLTVFGALVFVWILLFSASAVSGYEVPDRIDYDHLDQQDWGLYAPDPPTTYSWYVVEAEQEDGRRVDAIDGGAVDFDRPPDGSAAYKTFRHRKFMRLVRSSGQGHTSSTVADSYGEWACRQANDRYDGATERVTVYQLLQSIPLDGRYEEPDRRLVLQQGCEST